MKFNAHLDQSFDKVEVRHQVFHRSIYIYIYRNSLNVHYSHMNCWFFGSVINDIQSTDECFPTQIYYLFMHSSLKNIYNQQIIRLRIQFDKNKKFQFILDLISK